MRHRKRRSRLSMMTSRRKATIINMVRGLFEHQRIHTIHARAKEARRLAESLITLGKEDTVAARRKVYSVLNDRDLVGKLFKEIAPLFKNRTSGYTRIIPLGFRRGDGASLAILELTETTIKPLKAQKKKKEKAKAEIAHTEAPKEPAGAEEKKKAPPEKKEEPKIKQVPKSKPTLEEERKQEKAKAEDKKASGQKGFMKNIRGLFRKRGDR
ncbi:MAG: 50S ribosomal protein L17 [Candidatus Omnitrophica bacterium]|nr:50S ribosomal protein L17 [Candidatus Omnitrophota bacterium]MCM8790126.1 50S ribosomal protein L17 [Candidatus Omnitrophota bacterium]